MPSAFTPWRVAGLLLLVALLLAPWVGMYPILVMKLLCIALFAGAYNLMLGYTGLLSFGHAAFFGAGAYVAGHTLKAWQLPPEAALLLATGCGAALGWLFGVLAIRRQGIYFAMITLALAQLVYFVLMKAPFTGGEDGLQGVPRGTLFGLLDLRNDLVLYYIVVAIAVAAFGLLARIVHSPFGAVLVAVRENEPRALSLGYRVERVKLLVFVLSAALSGLAGALKTLVLGFATLVDAHWSTSGQVILMTMIGGVGTLAGPLLGTTVVVFLENRIGEAGVLLASLTGIGWFRALAESVTVVTGVAFIACVWGLRQGIAGAFKTWERQRRAKTSFSRLEEPS
jgi:branched-chain amino acid transport system permease protein